MLLEILLFSVAPFRPKPGKLRWRFSTIGKAKWASLKTTGPPAIFAQNNFPGQIIYPS